MCTENEEIRETCQPHLPNLPKVVMEEVLRYLDCPSIFRLRKVSRNLRYSIDEIKPELHLNSIKFELPLTASLIESNLENTSEFSKNGFKDSLKPRTGCSLKWKQGNVYKYPQITMKDAETLLKNPKMMLNDLRIDLRVLVGNSIRTREMKKEHLKKFCESLKALLENGDHLLKNRRISLHLHRLSQGADFLKYIDPKKLKYISIQTKYGNVFEADEMDCSELEELEQWKNADVLKIDGNYILTLVESFSTFKTIFIRCNLISMESVNEIKELFARSPKLKTFIVESNNFEVIMHSILSHFDPFDSYNEEIVTDSNGNTRVKREIWTWIHNVLGSKFQITLNYGSGHHIKFSRVV